MTEPLSLVHIEFGLVTFRMNYPIRFGSDEHTIDLIVNPTDTIETSSATHYFCTLSNRTNKRNSLGKNIEKMSEQLTLSSSDDENPMENPISLDQSSKCEYHGEYMNCAIEIGRMKKWLFHGIFFHVVFHSQRWKR